MNDKELLERNIRLAFEVAQTAIADENAASELASASGQGGLVLADPSDPELSLANQQLAEVLVSKGENVNFVQVSRVVSIASVAR
jgi:hypothetical protein